MSEDLKNDNRRANWAYEDWRVDWRTIAWVAIGGAVTIALALGGNWLFYKEQPADFSPKPLAQLPGPGLNAADDRTPQWRQARGLSPADSERISAAMQRIVAKGDAAWDDKPDVTP